jgi:photosystem II stability/assembly factor-like uncharacterized protein
MLRSEAPIHIGVDPSQRISAAPIGKGSAGCYRFDGGETTTGETGAVLRSGDCGQTWRSPPLPVRPNATMWGLATHPADGNHLVAWSPCGEVYITEDSGESWCKIAREFGEIRTAAWVPG